MLRVYPGEPTPWEFSQSSQPLAGATVTVISVHYNGTTAASDQSGTAELRALTCGPMTVRVSKTGYADSLAFMVRVQRQSSLADVGATVTNKQRAVTAPSGRR